MDFAWLLHHSVQNGMWRAYADKKQAKILIGNDYWLLQKESYKSNCKTKVNIFV